jgi:DNA-binding NarL/FixJ family response regulator
MGIFLLWGLPRRRPLMGSYSIVLADDHTLVRQGLRKIVEGKDDLQVVGEAADGIELLFLLDKLKPNMVILDISMPNLQGIQTARQIKMKYPGMKILIMTMHKEREYLYEAISAGAEGYLLKEDAEQELFAAIDTLRGGKGFISPIVLGEMGVSKNFMEKVFKFVLEN